MTTTCLNVASRPTTASYWPPCTAPGAQSCTETSVTCAPSPTSTATPPEYFASPVWSSTTVAFANAPTSTTSWPQTTSSPPVPARPQGDRAVELRLRGDADDGRAVGVLPGERGEPVGRLGQALEQRVVGLDAWSARRRRAGRRPTCGCASEGAPSSSDADPLHRREAPRLLAARGHAEGVRVGRGEPLGRRAGGRGAAVRVRARRPTPVPSAGVVGGPACAPTPGAKSSARRPSRW